MPGAMGDTQLTAQELTAWAKGAAVNLNPWEFEALLKLSEMYAVAKAAAESPDCPAPWIEKPTDENRQKIVQTVKNLWRSK